MMSYVKFPQAPFARAPFGECRRILCDQRFQGAAKRGRQKDFDRFLSSSGLFRSLLVTFLMLQTSLLLPDGLLFARLGEPLTATRKDRYKILRQLSPLLGWGNLRFTAQIRVFSANVSNPQGGKSTNFSAGKCHSGEIKVSTSTVAALFSKMALTGQRIAMVDMAFLVFTAFSYLP